MNDVIENLRRLNRKERFFLVAKAGTQWRVRQVKAANTSSENA